MISMSHEAKIAILGKLNSILDDERMTLEGDLPETATWFSRGKISGMREVLDWLCPPSMTAEPEERRLSHDPQY